MIHVEEESARKSRFICLYKDGLDGNYSTSLRDPESRVELHRHHFYLIWCLGFQNFSGYRFFNFSGKKNNLHITLRCAKLDTKKLDEYNFVTDGGLNIQSNKIYKTRPHTIITY